jgi:hypothetical protein
MNASSVKARKAPKRPANQRPTKKKKVNRDNVPGGLVYKTPSVVHPHLLHYLASEIPRTARLNPDNSKYEYMKEQTRRSCGGLHRTLKKIFFPNYREIKAYKKKPNGAQASSIKEGIKVDLDLCVRVEGGKSPRESPLARLLYEFITVNLGHTLQAAQVPVELTQWKKMTKCDVISMDSNGHLWLWEVKCGYPSNLNTARGNFTADPFKHVPCTKLNMWHLQVFYTGEAFIKAGVPIYRYNVLQVYKEKNQMRVQPHKIPEWLLPYVTCAGLLNKKK